MIEPKMENFNNENKESLIKGFIEISNLLESGKDKEIITEIFGSEDNPKSPIFYVQDKNMPEVLTSIICSPTEAPYDKNPLLRFEYLIKYGYPNYEIWYHHNEEKLKKAAKEWFYNNHELTNSNEVGSYWKPSSKQKLSDYLQE